MSSAAVCISTRYMTHKPTGKTLSHKFVGNVSASALTFYYSKQI
jgi:hypothetical protein